MWTWTALDADSKLIVQWFIAGGDGYSAKQFMDDPASRLANRVQLTGDGHRAYLEAVEGAFGAEVDYAQLVKLYGEAPEARKRYSPAGCVGCRKARIEGNPDPAHISTSYVERLNLTMRTHIGRFTRLTNAFSRKFMSQVHVVALYTVWYNFVRIHKMLRVTPAMAAGLTDRLMSMEDAVALIDAREAAPKKRGRSRESRFRFQTETLPAMSIDTTPDGLPTLGSVVRSLGLSARKSLGQHFILDLNLTRRIARAAGPLEGRTVVEVGPGPGGLTRALLLEGAQRVVAVERDERCLPALQAIAARYPGRLDMHLADALAVDWRALIAGSGGAGSSGKAVIAANLPYNVATLLLAGWLETEPWPPWFVRMVLMFQREVAERVVAQPATKAYGRLAVLAQWRTRARLLFTLKPEAFTPPPAVASAVVELTPLERPQPECKAATLSKVTAAAFGQRRKMLRQSLKPLVADAEPLLAALGLAPTLRGEALTVHDFARLAYTLERWPGRR